MHCQQVETLQNITIAFRSFLLLQILIPGFNHRKNIVIADAVELIEKLVCQLWNQRAFILNSNKSLIGAQKDPRKCLPRVIESWKRRMHKCFKVEGDYFEGI